MQTTSVRLISIILVDDRGAGHNIPYAKSVGKACSLLGWRHTGIFPSTNPLASLPVGWEATLVSWDSSEKHGFTRKLRAIIRLAASLRSTLRSHLRAGEEHCVLMVDSFTVMKLFAVLTAIMFLPKDHLSIWILHRYDYPDNSLELRAYKLMNWLFKKILPKGSFQLLTDSQLVQAYLSRVFDYPLHVLPIPHAFPAPTSVLPKESGAIICWWPGKPLESKGLSIMRQIVASNGCGASNFRLVAARESGLQEVPGGPKVELIPIGIGGQEYVHWMTTSDIILLPYDPISYKRRTSGIFVEAIIAGRMPLIRKGGWTSDELMRYDLNELEFDWNSPNVFTRMLQLLSDERVRLKLERMRLDYTSFHSVIGYAQALQSIWKTITIK